MTKPMLDLDAARREAAYPDGIPVRFRGEDYELPGELPVDVFDPFLTDEFDLAGLLARLLSEDDTLSFGKQFVAVLTDRPNLPAQVIQALQDALAALFGEAQWERWLAGRPSVQDYSRLLNGLFDLYGVGLGEAFAPPASSGSGGETQSQTLPGSTPDSTPEPSGDGQGPETGS